MTQKAALSYPHGAVPSARDEFGGVRGRRSRHHRRRFYLYATGRRLGPGSASSCCRMASGTASATAAGGFVALMHTSNGLDGGYSQMQSWVMGPHERQTMSMPACPRMRSGCAGMTGRLSPFIPSKGLVSWCAWG